MKIKKIGHCCLLIRINDLVILTDPGGFTVEQNLIKGIDIILITHEHADHLHVGSLRQIISNNPKAKVITNSGVGKILISEGVEFDILEGKSTMKEKGVLLEAFEGKHEEIFEEMGQVQNTGYFIGGKLFYPGDSYHDPEKGVDVLALPVAGPWCKIPDAIRYALKVKPKIAFPVHDGSLQADKIGAAHKIPEKVLAENKIEFMIMNAGDEREF